MTMRRNAVGYTNTPENNAEKAERLVDREINKGNYYLNVFDDGSFQVTFHGPKDFGVMGQETRDKLIDMRMNREACIASVKDSLDHGWNLY